MVVPGKLLMSNKIIIIDERVKTVPVYRIMFRLNKDAYDGLPSKNYRGAFTLKEQKQFRAGDIYNSVIKKLGKLETKSLVSAKVKANKLYDFKYRNKKVIFKVYIEIYNEKIKH
jgi:hypothetical protein